MDDMSFSPSVYLTTMSYWFNISRNDYVKVGGPVAASSEWYDGPDQRHQLDIEMTGVNVWTVTPYYIGGPHKDTKIKYDPIVVSDGFKILTILYNIRKLGGVIYGEDDVIF